MNNFLGAISSKSNDDYDDDELTILDSLYDLSKFEDHFRISRNVFLRIARDLENNYEFFQLRWDTRGKHGLLHYKNAHQLLDNCCTA
uniref:Uncharacterized protein n=1 Tax=Lactuca sativa TaxID=4236 RepID=A0A9R1VJY6_LACSA|nr:hypothetical protein LSAT_V11C400194090 [Lactuca sativa]